MLFAWIWCIFCDGILTGSDGIRAERVEKICYFLLTSSHELCFSLGFGVFYATGSDGIRAGSDGIRGGAIS